MEHKLLLHKTQFSLSFPYGTETHTQQNHASDTNKTFAPSKKTQREMAEKPMVMVTTTLPIGFFFEQARQIDNSQNTENARGAVQRKRASIVVRSPVNQI